MNNGARLFAYGTWVVMISLGIIVFTHNFLIFVTDPGWIGLVALLAYGFVYLNFTYLAVKRFIRKVLEETILHYVIALLMLLPPGIWVGLVSEDIEGSRFILLVVLAFSCGLGAYYGNKTGQKEKQAYIEKLEEQQSG